MCAFDAKETIGQRISLSKLYEASGGGGEASIEITSMLMTFVGPNGSGKTRAMKFVRNHFRSKDGNGHGQLDAKQPEDQPPMKGHHVRYISSGRLSPLEGFRSSVDGGYSPHDNSTVGHQNHTGNRINIESVTGDFLALKDRPDLLMKVSCRLESLFKRKLKLEWMQNGLAISFGHGSSSYAAGYEASGLLHLVSLLAAIYDDDIDVLLIDEPEVSLHPQYQSFLLKEIILATGGVPASQARKLVIIATHSPSMLWLPGAETIPAMVFFQSDNRPPRQLPKNDGTLLKAIKVGFFPRFGEAHRIALFAPTILMVEGVSEKIIVSSLADKLDYYLGANGVEILPVSGNGDLPIGAEIFWKLGKKVVIITDLDTIIDGTDLATTLYEISEKLRGEVAKLPDSPAKEFASRIKSRLFSLIDKKYSEISSLYKLISYYKKYNENEVPESIGNRKVIRRSASAAILSNPNNILPNDEWKDAASYLSSMLNLLASSSCYVLRRGSLEDYFDNAGGERKPQNAADKVKSIHQMTDSEIENQFPEIVKALKDANEITNVDEIGFLRREIAGIAGKIHMHLTNRGDESGIASILEENGLNRLFSAKAVEGRKISISLTSSLFSLPFFPILVSHDNIIRDINSALQIGNVEFESHNPVPDEESGSES